MKRRILFVDDEPKLLAGLERLLHPQRNQWEMVFVSGGEVALAELAKRLFDVIVTDMGMPGMNGAQLLQHVQERFPQVVRLVLSGHTDAENALRAIPVAHQFLSKPCSPDVLRNAVDRACNLQALLRRGDLRKIVGEIRGLPSRPEVFSALLQAIANPESSLGQLAQIVAGDVSLCAKILQLVNSAFFGLARQLSSIQEAVSYLGINMIKNLALSFKTFQTLDGCRRIPGFSQDALQHHALLTANIARRLITGKRETEDACAAGMLHDVGKLILATKLPDHLARALELSRSERRPLHLVEEELNGFTHAELGAYLLGLWGLPYPVVESVAFHHNPEKVEKVNQKSFDVVAAVHVADSLANEQASAAKGSGAGFEPIPNSYLEALGVADQLPRWREMAAAQNNISVLVQ